MELIEQTISRKEIYQGVVLHVVCDTVRLPNGKTAPREYCLHPGAAAVVPLCDDETVLMVRQYRYAHRRVFFEIPAGKLDDKGEPPLVGATRELREETGAVAERYTYLGPLDTSPALMDERIHLYLAEGLTFENQDLDEDEFLTVEKVPLIDLVQMVMRGEIADSKTQAAILKTYLYKKGGLPLE